MQHYFGIFEDIHNLYEDKIENIGMYDTWFAHFYDKLPLPPEELEIYITKCLQYGKEILELCCGNGRLTIPLAQNGFKVDGIDLSKDMLRLLDDKVEKLPKSIQKRVHTTYGDVFNLNLHKKYDMILLPATTICILSDDSGKLLKLLNLIEAHLKADGCFIFDYRIVAEVKETSEIISLCEKGDNYTALTLMQDFKHFNPGRIIGNFFTQIEYADGLLERVMTYTDKKNITDTFVDDLFSHSNLIVAERERIPIGNDELTFAIAKRKSECYE
ncbi:MAG: class I SAM-dependent methyltransferase [Syntrophaceticus sp.]|nr:class I SAM-dependent methyltransferase [Syntrophaceticus sp.]MDD3314002.1 class I SAM-dependent methyltransferase [Syntrophaceticus sp.]MDD4359311.1 class I SAM-dependent methyltransferase [Syntrophaceticus sp.]MDD4782285.1 class I SAM-dependent methyltransferase [Syntrophaceticus sp.]